MTRRIRLGLAAGLLWMAAGCDSGPVVPGAGRMIGTVITLDGRAPVAGARLVLIDPSTNTPSTPVVESDANGRYTIDGVPPGWHYLVVFAVYDRQQMLYDLIDHPFQVAPGATLRRDVAMDSYRYFNGGDVTVRGHVVDAVTDAPLAGAWVSIGSSDLAFLFSGSGVPWETVTNARGEFRLSVPLKLSDDNLTVLGLQPIIAVRQGYRPAATGSRRRGEWLPLGDTADVVIGLTPGEGAEHLRGEVRYGDRPVPGVVVGLSIVDTTGFMVNGPSALPAGSPGALLPKAVLPGQAVVTDELGRFDLKDVPSGFYRIQAGYLPDDGWFSEDDRVYVEVGDRDVAGLDVLLLPAVTMVSPAPGAIVDTGQPLLVWRAMDSATRYRVAYSRPNDFQLSEHIDTADTSVTMRSGIWGDGDHGRWAVYAYRDGAIIGGPETIGWIQVDSR